jgi:hypothetical protein
MSITKIYRKDNQPFAVIPNEAIRNPLITSNAFRLLAYIMSHQDGYEVTYEQIERQTSLGRFAINQAIANLTSLGWLQVDRPKLPNGQFGAKSWTVLDPHSTTVGNSTVESPHVVQSTDIKKNTSKEEHVKEELHAQDELEPAFEEFWKVYPRKVGKVAAKKAFAKAAKEVGCALIAVGVQRFAHDPYKPAKQFLPHPATWLNEGRWDDEPYPPRELTPEEKQAFAKEQNERRRQADLEASRKLREEMAEQERRAKANPPKRCEHDRIRVMCPQCRDQN